MTREDRLTDKPTDKLTEKPNEPNPYQAPGEEAGHRPDPEFSDLSKGQFDRESYVAARSRWNTRCLFVAAALFTYCLLASLLTNILFDQYPDGSGFVRLSISWSVLLAFILAVLVATFGRVTWYFFHWWR